MPWSYHPARQSTEGEKKKLTKLKRQRRKEVLYITISLIHAFFVRQVLSMTQRLYEHDQKRKLRDGHHSEST